MKTKTTGLFVGNINPVLRQKIENAFLRAKPRVIEDMYSRYGEDPTQVGGGCLFWAAYGADELDKLGIATQVQAGTMFWMTVPRSDISKLSRTRMTNFGYQYGYDNPMSVKNVLEGGIPEMHVWLAIDDQQVIVDFSTGCLKAAYDTATSGRQTGCEWLAKTPPPYLALEAGSYSDVDMEGHAFAHNPEPEACVIALKAMNDLLVPKGIKPSCMNVPEKMNKFISTATLRYLETCKMVAQERKVEREAKANRDATSVHR